MTTNPIGYAYKNINFFINKQISTHKYLGKREKKRLMNLITTLPTLYRKMYLPISNIHLYATDTFKNTRFLVIHDPVTNTSLLLHQRNSLIQTETFLLSSTGFQEIESWDIRGSYPIDIVSLESLFPRRKLIMDTTPVSLKEPIIYMTMLRYFLLLRFNKGQDINKRIDISI